MSLFAGLSTVLAGCGSDAGSAVVERTAGGPVPPEPTVSTPDEALARLTAGNQRFASGAVRHPDETTARRMELVAGQHPFAVIFSCVDSRVPPELVFDQGLGDLFVIRSAGQVLDRAILGSLQYGIAELKIPLLMVLGHEKCGAVKATVEAVEKKSAAGGNDIDALVAAIRPAVVKAEGEHPTDLLDSAIRMNVSAVVADLGGKFELV